MKPAAKKIGKGASADPKEVIIIDNDELEETQIKQMTDRKPTTKMPVSSSSNTIPTSDSNTIDMPSGLVDIEARLLERKLVVESLKLDRLELDRERLREASKKRPSPTTPDESKTNKKPRQP